eukprot:scaffold1068_cov167-Amphora_coffeaeformis.AAC.16
MTYNVESSSSLTSNVEGKESSCPLFSVTGSAAHTRFRPLVPSDWIDASPYGPTKSTTATTAGTTTQTQTPVIDFLWENAPRHETRAYRDKVTVYSHLPNGTDILDSKWVLALNQQQRQKDPSTCSPFLATLEAHCFRGREGFVDFCHQIGLYEEESSDSSLSVPSPADIPDLAENECTNKSYTYRSGKAPSWWVVKDASSNGAGGIWVVGPSNAQEFGAPQTSPLLTTHKYVAQKYAWPCVLYQGRKTHIRVYGLFTADGRAWLHRRCFLHVANDAFLVDTGTNDNNQQKQEAFVDSVHITNCCANSHNADKFAGEICATLFDSHASERDNDDIDLSRFFPSIQASMSELAHRTFPFLQGGTANSGLEYLGLDFILSYNAQGQPLAYLLEVNAPPSQDTATGLPHAEDLHNDVLRDLMTLWVIPKVSFSTIPPRAGGWRCVYQHADYPFSDSKAVPSKAAILNRMRWALFESKITKRQEKSRKEQKKNKQLPSFTNNLPARKYFDYYLRSDNPPVFWENGGGTQVPRQVIARMTASLQDRHRNIVGAGLKEQARKAMAKLLGATEGYEVCFGANATTLLAKTATLYQGVLSSMDEIVLSLENHWAHVEPWTTLAKATGTKIVWWDPSVPLEELLTEQTRLVALTHASNVVGQVREVSQLIQITRDHSPRAHVVVDGVAAAPHVFAAVQVMDADYYVVSCHKMFGPHCGSICAKRATSQLFSNDEKGLKDLYESGTVNYDACAGVQGMLEYFEALGTCSLEGASFTKDDTSCIEKAYALIGDHEARLARALIGGLRRSPKVKVLATLEKNAKQLPVVSFVHESISCADLVDLCAKEGFICRQDTFLTSRAFLEQHPQFARGFVRFSLVHYNTPEEVQHVLNYLETLPNWI